MNTRTRTSRRMPVLLLISAAAVLSAAAPVWAVVPGLAGPIQALTQLLPQIAPVLAAGVAGLFSSRRWRQSLRSLVRSALTRRGLVTAGLLLALGFGIASLHHVRHRAMALEGTSQQAGEWTMFRANLLRTGSDGMTAGPERPAVSWSFEDASSDFSSSPALAAGKLYIGSIEASLLSSSGAVDCVDAKTGAAVWQFPTPHPVFSSPAVSGGRVYVGEGLHTDSGCSLYCLDAATGHLIWKFRTHSHVESSPTISDGRVYVGAGDDGVYCVDARSGNMLWHHPGMHVDLSPAVASGRVFIGAGYGRLLASALDATTGRTLWETPSDLPVWGPPSIAGSSVYFGVGNGDFMKSAQAPRGGIWRLDAASGKPTWRCALPDAVLGATLLHNDRVFAGCRDGQVYAVDLNTGRIAWNTPCGGPVVSSPVSDGQRLYAAAGSGLNVLDESTGQSMARLDLSASTSPDVRLFSSPALQAGHLYLGTSADRVLCLTDREEVIGDRL